MHTVRFVRRGRFAAEPEAVYRVGSAVALCRAAAEVSLEERGRELEIEVHEGDAEGERWRALTGVRVRGALGGADLALAWQRLEAFRAGRPTLTVIR